MRVKILISYATAVFDEHFDDQSVITEYRQSLGDYLASSPVEHIRFPSLDQFSALQAENYPDLDSYGKAQAQLWFGTLQLIDHEELWRVELSRALKKHFLFQNLLRLLNGQIADWQDLLQQFKRGLGVQVEASDEFVEQLLGSLVALVSIARNDGFLQAEDDPQAIERLRELATQSTLIKLNPLLDVRMQLWLRELRRLLVLLPKQDEQPQLLFADDGKVPQDRIALPAIHCRDCGSMGMLTHKADDQQRVSTDLDLIYRAFFERSAKSCLLFPMDQVDVPWNFPDSLDRHICSCCGFLNRRSQKSCQNCGSEDLLWVHIPDNNKVEKNKHTGESNNKSHNDCPFCQSRGSLLIVGARSTSLSSVMVGQLSASPFNKDKQLIAFSDAVQDTAHRAGYIGARTRSFGFRVALKRVIDQSPEPVSLAQLIDRFNQYWLAELGDSAFIGIFLPTDMEWLRDFSALKKDGHLPVGSNLLKLVQRRMGFEILSEMGFRSRIGRSLERSSASACFFDSEVLQDSISNLLITLQETVGPLKQLEQDELDRFIRGLLTYLRVAGGVYSPELEGYIKESGNAGVFIRQLHLPNFAPNARVPTFLGTKKTKGLDTLVGTQNTGASWYQTWLQKNLFRDDLLQQSGDMDAAIYHAVLKQLLKSQILVELTGTGETVWAINPDSLLVGGSSTKLRCSRCHHSHHVAVGEAAIWTGALCLRKSCLGHYQVDHNHNSASDFYHQRIYGSKVILGQCGIKITGRSKKLRINYRTTEQIRSWAVSLLNGIAFDDLDDGVDEQVGYRSLMTGPTPIIEKFNTAKDEAEYIIKSLKELTDQEQAKACIVVRRHIDIDRFIAALVDAGISYYQIEQNTHDSSSQSGVRIATMHRVKGLEFDYMYVASINEGVMPLNVVDSDDPTIIREHEQKERSLLYVAITRAKRFCSITSFGKPSSFIG